jgi:hypothetical protein
VIFVPFCGHSSSEFLVGAVGWLIFPLKYLDIWMNRLPSAHVLANHLYVVAKR